MNWRYSIGISRNRPVWVVSDDSKRVVGTAKSPDGAREIAERHGLSSDNWVPEVCPTCNGHGWVWDVHEGGQLLRRRKDQCPDCGGDGQRYDD